MDQTPSPQDYLRIQINRDFKFDEGLVFGARFWKKVANTFLCPTWIWKHVIRDADADAILAGKIGSKTGVRAFVEKSLRRGLWFWPRLVDGRIWVTDKFDPSPFREMTSDSRYLVEEVSCLARNFESPLLDLGCNCGRHLALLADMGHTNLHGVDISKTAIEKMKEWFPQLTSNCDARVDLMQRYLAQAESRSFDVVFTRGATVELIHPSFPLVKELCRITDSYVALMITENTETYPRFWIYEFYRNGFMLTNLVRPVQQIVEDKESNDGTGVSLLVFRRIPS